TNNAHFVAAAIYYLRTFLEKHARRVTASVELDGDKLMAEYMATLPLKVRGIIPSFTTIYASLCGPLHDGRDDDAVFAAALADINGHFEVVKAVADLPVVTETTVTTTVETVT